MKHTPALGAALCAALLFTPLVRAQTDLYVGSNTPANTLDLTNGTNAYANTYVGFTVDASNNALGVYNAGTLLTNTSELFVGRQGSGNTMTVADGAVVAAVSSYMSYWAVSSNNSVLVTGTNSLWQNSSVLHVGYSGNGNRLVISNGGTALNFIGSIGTFGSDNIVEVTGAGSLWTNSGDLWLGYETNANGNQLVVSNGGTVAAKGLLVGYWESLGNSLVVTGTNSLLQASRNVVVGRAGAGNQLVVSDGGTLASAQYGNLGQNFSSSNNVALVTGAGSLWTNALDLFIGGLGSGNRLTVSNAGTVANAAGLVGSGSIGNGNEVVVTGTNSLWTNSADLTIGNSGSSNSLVIADGGAVANSNGYIGFSASSSNNTALVTGANSLWTNSGEFTVGLSGTGNTLTLADGGALAASNITVASAAGSSGTLNLGRFGTNDTAGTILAPTIAFGAGTGAINFNQSDATTITAAISGAGTLNQLGAGTTTLSGANTYSGATIVSAGTLAAGASGALSGNSAVTVDSGGILSLIGTTNEIGSLAGAGVVDNGSVDNAALTAGGDNTSTTFSGNINDGIGGGALSLTKSGAGTLTFAGLGSYSGDTTIEGGELAISGSISNNALLYVGFAGSGNSLVISNGGAVANSNGYIGFSASSSNNTALVTGANSLWTNSGDLYVGDSGSSNSLVIANGGTVQSQFLVLGGSPLDDVPSTTSSNNSVLVTGGGSAWNGYAIAVGFSGSGNSLVISNDGTVANTDGLIGFAESSSNNSVLVTDGGTWTNSDGLIVGLSGSGNSLVISNGGTVQSSLLDIGGSSPSPFFPVPSTTSSNNSVLVTGEGSAWSGDAVGVGNSSSGNSLVISDGGTVANVNGVIGAEESSSNNSVLVTGANSLWIMVDTGVFPNIGALIVGDSGSSNSLIISNGGTVQSQFLVLGGSPFDGAPSTTSSNNSVLVTGEGSAWNGSAIAVGFSGSGNSLVISNGGRVVSFRIGDIGVFDTSSNNSVLVTGANSLWTNSGEFNVGVSGTGNTLTLADGGALAASNITIAASNGSSGTLNLGRFGTNDTAGTILAPTIAFGAGTGAINFNQSDAVTITSSTSGAGTLNQLGAGTTTLSGTNTYSGDTTISGGTLSLANENAAGSGRIIQTALTSLVEFLGAGRMTNEMSVFQYSFDENFEAAGQVTLADAASSMAVADGRTLTGSGSFAGAGGLTKLGAGSLALTASNSFSGPLSVVAGTLQLASLSGAAAGSVTSVSVSSGATLLVSRHNQVNNGATVTLSGGTIRTASGVSEVFGNLNLTQASFLDFGTTSYANANTISFGTYNYTPSALLTINNFDFGSTMTFGSNLSTTDLATFSFTNGGIGSSSWDGSTFTITAIPEPSTYVAAIALLALMLWPLRRRLRGKVS